jgi:uncharacterized protein YegJ (DUF2314 family)
MSEPLFFHSGADQQMAEASKAARRTFGFFWRELSWESRRIVPGLSVSAVKHGFRTDPGSSTEVEYMWVSDVQFDGATISGALLNQPNHVRGMNAGDPVSFPRDALADWLYAMHDDAFGGFTIQVMRAAMNPAERQAHDDAWGLRFGDAGVARLTERLRYGELLTLDPQQVPEHPMSLNMEAKSRDGIRGLGRRLDEKRVGDLTLLQYEALAGNLTQVKLLLEHGARRDLADAKGRTAVDLARAMGWEKIVRVLSE